MNVLVPVYGQGRFNCSALEWHVPWRDPPTSDPPHAPHARIRSHAEGVSAAPAHSCFRSS